MSIDGEGTFVVDRSLRAQLLRGADAYRNRTLVAIGPNEIGRIEVHRPDGQGFTLEHKGGSVQIARVSLRASRSAADQIFAAVADGRAKVDGFGVRWWHVMRHSCGSLVGEPSPYQRGGRRSIAKRNRTEKRALRKSVGNLPSVNPFRPPMSFICSPKGPLVFMQKSM